MVTQITSLGGTIQAKKGPITVAETWREAGSPLALDSRPQGAYLHVPFCFHKCHYCDFYSIVDSRDRQEAFVRRLIGEIERARPFLTAPLRTMFVGGGTPTLLAAGLWQQLLAALADLLPWEEGAEFTVEANPETVTGELIEVLAAGGVNRLSIGAQSFDSRHLKTLERWHDPENVGRSLALARAGGIENLNLDLIFAVPGQAQEDWLHDLDRALSLEPSHLSCYGLTYEPNTPLTARVGKGLIRPVEDEVEAAMYEATVERLRGAGFEHYEVSNWARPGRRCAHNLVYWRNHAWWPLGPGASGHAGGWRWRNAPRLDLYLQSTGLAPIEEAEQLDEDGRVGEELMLGLRLVEGIPAARLEALLARGARGAERGAAIARHEASGLLAREEDHLHLTARGLLLADTVLADLVQPIVTIELAWN